METRRLFSNRLLERLSRTPVGIPIVMFIVYGASLLYWSIVHTELTWITITLLFAIGLFAFTWVEYNVHRFLFHMNTHTPARQRLQYTLHGVHHEFPKDKDRLAMPPLLSISIATFLLFLVSLLLNTLAFPFMAGFLCGYAAYLFIHYLIHAYPPQKNFMRFWWINHSRHHYKDGGTDFGVTSPFWDHMYGTMSRTQR